MSDQSMGSWALGCDLTIFSLMLWLGSPILAAVAPARETLLSYFKLQFE